MNALLGDKINLDDYDVFTNMKIHFLDVPIDGKTVNYFRADQALVKVGENTAGLNEIEDIIIFENKLSFGTPLSKNQNAAVQARGKLEVGGNPKDIVYKSPNRDANFISDDQVRGFLRPGEKLGSKVSFKKVTGGTNETNVGAVTDLPYINLRKICI